MVAPLDGHNRNTKQASDLSLCPPFIRGGRSSHPCFLLFHHLIFTPVSPLTFVVLSSSHRLYSSPSLPPCSARAGCRASFRLSPFGLLGPFDSPFSTFDSCVCVCGRRLLPPFSLPINLCRSFLLLLFSSTATMDSVDSLLSRAGPGPQVDPEVKKAMKAISLSLSNYLYIICGAIAGAVIIWKVLDTLIKYTRHIVCLNNDRQRYFALPSPWMSWIKKHILYAPVLRKRHNREIQLSAAFNVGTLPTRFQLSFLTAYLISNVVFCVIDIRFQDDFDTVTRVVRNRSGVLATINLVPLFLLAGRNNPLIPLLGISFDTYNLIHRWFGRIVVLEALTHTLAHLAKGGWGPAFMRMFGVPYHLWGFIVSPNPFAFFLGYRMTDSTHNSLPWHLSFSVFRLGAPFVMPSMRFSRFCILCLR